MCVCGETADMPCRLSVAIQQAGLARGRACWLDDTRDQA